MPEIGYARVSMADQDPALQFDALAEAGCARVFQDKASDGGSGLRTGGRRAGRTSPYAALGDDAVNASDRRT
ncbi:recombinase family protein [Inquilinus sp. OTU3971]|uniref:recombinase family protein n=1 Tax=Inquilinus sp. OTU3971 TaxID=3043855 RepID=UPI00313C520A